MAGGPAEERAAKMKGLVQMAIVIFSCSGYWFVSRPEPWRRWGFVLGLVGQPFWVWMALESGLWSVLAVSAWITYTHLQGIYFYWIKVDQKARDAQ